MNKKHCILCEAGLVDTEYCLHYQKIGKPLKLICVPCAEFVCKMTKFVPGHAE